MVPQPMEDHMADDELSGLDARWPETSEIKHAWAGIVGGDGIKPGIWYSLNADGLPVIVGAL